MKEMSAINIGAESQKLMTDLKIAAAKAQGTPFNIQPSSGGDFANVLKNAIDKVNDLQSETDKLQRRFEVGDPSVDLPNVMIAMQKSKIAFTAMTEVRNKLVKAYQDIMSMPV